MKPYQNAVIFAGGKSSRMGEDKALLPFGDYKTLTQFQYRKLTTLFDNVYISSKNNKFDFDCTVIKDIYTDASPLVALLSVFQTLKIESVFVLAVDAPFVDNETIETIMNVDRSNIDAVIAMSPNGIEPLCGVYKRSMLPILQAQYKKKNHKLRTLLDAAQVHIVKFDKKYTFTNLNHPNEYKEALKEVPIRRIKKVY